MKVAGKINALVIAIAASASVLYTATTTVREYSFVRDRLLEQITDAIAARPQLPAAIYYRDGAEQRAILGELVATSGAIRYAYLRDPDGRQLKFLLNGDSPEIGEIGFTELRGTRSVAETGLTSRRAATSPGGHYLLSALLSGDVIWDYTLPVLSPLNPLDSGISPERFAAAIIGRDSATADFVIGYTHLGISRNILIAQALPATIRALTLSLLFVLACAVFSRYMTRRITAPFSIINRMADDISAGRPVETHGLETSGEFKQIVTLLNTIIGGLNSYKTKMDVDHQLLSMKVEERTSQLTKRNRELKRAVKEVTDTKNRLRQLAYYDSLTDLPNRRLFTEQLDLLIRMSRRSKGMIALLFLDLDNFKRINDSLGHSAGDLLLREVARRLSRCVRESDLVGHYVEPNSRIDVSRLGGDEFTVVLNQLDEPGSAAIVAQRLLDALRKPVTIEGHEMVVTPSIGIAIAPGDAENVDALLRAADTAMYHAKTSGKNRFVFYSADMDASGVERLTLENDLRRALENNELTLYYQPQINVATGSVIGAEALMRWHHPEHGLVPPPKFIALAEEIGLIDELGEWGLREACRHMVQLQAQGLDLPKVSVNVSALQFNRAFTDVVSRVLQETGLRPKRLQLELTESIMVESTGATLRTLDTLKELGVNLSIDDFGTGYSALSYLSRYPLDELKIDRTFVTDLDKSRTDASLVVAIIAMARSLRLRLVAEGVETQGQYQFLREHGANVIQGYLFSKPVPLEELKLMLSPGRFRDQIKAIELEVA